MGRREDAADILRALPESDWRSVEHRVEVLARAGLQREAETHFGAGVPGSIDRARLLALLGRQTDALDALDANTVLATTNEQWLYLPAVDPMRNDPRFIEFIATLGLTEAHARAQAWRAAHPPEKIAAKK